MTTGPNPVSPQREPELVGQTVVVIGGSAGIGLETARCTREAGANVILTARDPDRQLRQMGDRQHQAPSQHQPAAERRTSISVPGGMRALLRSGDLPPRI
jgi:NAD(P)-dependent dehydrogenase (short-subunit alcohol dehydrogenase family)